MNLSHRVRLEIDRNEVELTNKQDDEDAKVFLKSGLKNQDIRDANQLILAGHGYIDESSARSAAEFWRSTIMAVFAATYFGADFGDRAPRSSWMAAGLSMFERQSGRRVLNDVHGTAIYPSEADPLFASMSVAGVRGVQFERLEKATRTAVDFGYKLDTRQELAYELFSASFFQPYADARFLLLMMAIETLIDPAPRDKVVQNHIGKLISDTQTSDLPEREITSICGSLRWLVSQSIGQAGRVLAGTLGDKRYMDCSALGFFSDCYSVRSTLVHGALPRHSRQEVDHRAANLEVFVADLLAGPLKDC